MTLHVNHLRQCQTRAVAPLRLRLRGHGSAEFARLVQARVPCRGLCPGLIAALAARSGERVRATPNLRGLEPHWRIAQTAEQTSGVWHERVQLLDEQLARP